VRLAVGAFMILLALSYLLQDRAGGTLGMGFLVLSLSSLSTFACGVLTRRVQLARAPGEAAPAREPRTRLKPALATVNRWRIALAGSLVGLGRSVKTHLGPRERPTPATEAASTDTVEPPAETSAEIPAAIAAEPPLETSPEIPTAAASDPPAKTFSEIPTKVARETGRASDDMIVEMPAEPTEDEKTAAELSAEPPEERTAEEPEGLSAEPTKDEETTAEMPAMSAAPPEEEPEKKPVEKAEDKPEEKPEEPTRIAPLSALAEADPDAPRQPDGESSDTPSESTAKRKRAPAKKNDEKVEKVETEENEGATEEEEKQPAATGKDRKGPAAPA
jgi:hypothetical protein